ncbi:MAG: 50S ribosome-binding GTPase, partial [Pseudomonadota bacterium]|nr:50S ribosome-binding GTPase [Pseudomonadota bacterium]
MKPVIAIVGRPNVGKSTLFNRMTKTRDAIVADFAGLTRDRHYGDARVGEREFIVVDTGGFEPQNPTGIVREMAKQTRQAVAEADAVIFVVDVRAGVSAHDHDIARYLRSAGKKVLLAVNKAEGMADSPHLAEFHELALGEPLAVSAAHGQGIGDLAEAALEAALDDAAGENSDETPMSSNAADVPIRLAVAGRPNVGKSTLINA